MNYIQPRGYVCYHTPTPVKIDGTLKDPAWEKAPWTEDFVDIEGPGKPLPRFRTRAKMLWDAQYLYVGAELEEPQLWATLTKRDSIIYNDNDFEIFIDPDDDGQLYPELEINALNTLWDLLLVKPYRAGGPYLTGWDIAGIKTAVHLNGTLNTPDHPSHGWSVEFAIPWPALQAVSRVPSPPKDGDQWRINFSRVEWELDVVDGKYHRIPNRPEDNWVWSPQGVVDMHRPERWGILQFSESEQGPVALQPHVGLDERFRLTAVWDAMFDFRSSHGHWPHTLTEIPIDTAGFTLTATDDTFELGFGEYRLDSNQRFWHVSPRK